jgi:hypothetical protein
MIPERRLVWRVFSWLRTLNGRRASYLETAGPSTPLRFAQDDNCFQMMKAGPSTPLRFAQDDNFVQMMKKADPSTALRFAQDDDVVQSSLGLADS